MNGKIRLLCRWLLKRIGFPNWDVGIVNRVLTAILVIVFLGGIGILSYVIATPKMGETFTEFYILGQEGKAAGYPVEMELGQEARVIVGIINHEDKEVNYRIEVIVSGNKTDEVGSVVLVDEQKWEREVSFAPVTAGENQKVEFILYKKGEIGPYLKPLHLWINVGEYGDRSSS